MMPMKDQEPTRRLAWVMALLVGVVLANATAATPGSSKERLRALIRLPRISFLLEIGCSSGAGYYFIWSAAPTLSDLATPGKDTLGGIEKAAHAREIGLRYLAAGARDRARAALRESLNQLSELGGPQSADVTVLADYARTLMLLGQIEDALRAGRHAVEVAPDNPRAHGTLARCLIASAAAELMPASSSDAPLAHTALDDLANANVTVAPGSAEKARELATEAVRAADRAVEFAPGDAAVRLDRAVTRALDHGLRELIAASAGAGFTPAGRQSAWFPPSALEDLRRAAELAPADARLLGTAAMASVMRAALERGAASVESLLGTGAWSLLDESQRRQLRADLARLEGLAADGAPLAAATASELLGVIQLIALRDLTAAEANLRQALARDPDRDSAWEALVIVLVNAERFDALTAECESRLKRRESARDRLLLAKASAAAGDLTRALAVLEPARRRFPDDFNLNLAAAAALLHETTDDTTLAQAAQLISRAEKAAGNQPTAEQRANLLFLRGMFLALVEQPELARAHLRRVLELDPDREEAREALQLVE
jgi:tetratricopeptide (TPR) repeat protein